MMEGCRAQLGFGLYHMQVQFFSSHRFQGVQSILLLQLQQLVFFFVF